MWMYVNAVWDSQALISLPNLHFLILLFKGIPISLGLAIFCRENASVPSTSYEWPDDYILAKEM